MPEGWVIDAEGQPLTDPDQILDDLGQATAALLPLGGAGELLAGYKGYDLATMVEILSASLSGGVFMKDLLGFAADGSRRPYMLGHFFLAIDIEHFFPLDVSQHITGQIMRACRAPARRRARTASMSPAKRSTKRKGLASASKASRSTATCARNCRPCATSWTSPATRTISGESQATVSLRADAAARPRPGLHKHICGAGEKENESAS